MPVFFFSASLGCISVLKGGFQCYANVKPWAEVDPSSSLFINQWKTSSELVHCPGQSKIHCISCFHINPLKSLMSLGHQPFFYHKLHSVIFGIHAIGFYFTETLMRKLKGLSVHGSLKTNNEIVNDVTFTATSSWLWVKPKISRVEVTWELFAHASDCLNTVVSYGLEHALKSSLLQYFETKTTEGCQTLFVIMNVMQDSGTCSLKNQDPGGPVMKMQNKRQLSSLSRCIMTLLGPIRSIVPSGSRLLERTWHNESGFEPLNFEN